ncbi:TRAP transporter large permease subunit [Pararhodobacter sp. CCB-MM2]|uniref:TRAP transporter large permease n=1 Tax=Pararhodobacter sp. CCB-MM2 TaxID=1786003 RepID=UPI000833254C|nr:TRAP transporter large permease subunit [Pararhodobacter sp. CCB-MM2]MCA2011935.1 TRAP transporter large permease subunit [Cereibacter sphaeroides]
MTDLLISALPGGMFAFLVVGMFSGVPVAIVLMGISLVFSILAISLGEMRLVQATLLPNRIYSGVIENQVLVAAPMFILMGVIMDKTRLAEDLLLTMQRLLRRVPGGLALAVVAMGTILAAATGIIGASVVMLSMMAIPTMIEKGYDPGLAAGTVASSGTLGILIPPSVMLVFMGDLLSISLGRLFVAALVPGLLLSLMYMLYILIRATLQPSIAPRLPPAGPEDRVSLRETALSVLAPLALIIAVLGSILGGVATPTEAGGVGVAASILLGLARGRLSMKAMTEAQDSAVTSLGMLFFIFVGATAFAYVFRIVGGEHFVVEVARSLPFGDYGLLLALMMMVFVMGFFFDWIEITLILLPIFAPILRVMDLGDHIPQEEIIFWVAIMITVNLQTSFLTPPFGFALFYLKGAAGNLVSMRDIYRGVVPFVLMQLSVVLLILLFPGIAMWLPEQLFQQ